MRFVVNNNKLVQLNHITNFSINSYAIKLYIHKKNNSTTVFINFDNIIVMHESTTNNNFVLGTIQCIHIQYTLKKYTYD